jgi:hypothetical protein
LLWLHFLAAGGRAAPGALNEGMHEKLLPQVFISHTGQDPDARTFAASILYPALRGAGLPVFIDFAGGCVEKGSHWERVLERAAGSKVVVLVLSKSYASRFWCMRELHLALRAMDTFGSQPTIIPVYYHDEHTVLQPDTVLSRWGPTGDLYQKQSADRQAKINAAEWADNLGFQLLKSVKSWNPIFRRQEDQSPAKDEDRRVALEVVQACMRYLPPEQPVKAVGFEDQLSRVAAQLGGEVGCRLGVWLYGIGECHCGTFTSVC